MRIVYPTCPDTLRCYPLTKDPFLIKSSPHVYFCANQSEFDTKVLDNGTRLICVPSFKKTRQIVLIDLRDLSVFTIKFDCADLLRNYEDRDESKDNTN